MKIGTNVIVPDPREDDLHLHQFQGTIISLERGYVQVEDGDGNIFDIEPERLTLQYE